MKRQRKKLEEAEVDGIRVPLKTRERDLGFGISYSRAANVAVRKERITRFQLAVNKIVALGTVAKESEAAA